MEWKKTSFFKGILIISAQGILQESVIEFPMQTVATLLIQGVGGGREQKRAKCDKLTVILNYNLLAFSKDEVDECLRNMFQAFMGNLSPSVSA